MKLIKILLRFASSRRMKNQEKYCFIFICNLIPPPDLCNSSIAETGCGCLKIGARTRQATRQLTIWPAPCHSIKSDCGVGSFRYVTNVDKKKIYIYIYTSNTSSIALIPLVQTTVYYCKLPRYIISERGSTPVSEGRYAADKNL